MKIRDIEQAVTKLPRQKLFAFRVWFYKYDAQIWDKQFREDVKSGRLDLAADKAIEDFKKDRCNEL